MVRRSGSHKSGPSSRSESASAWEVTRQGQWEWVRVESQCGAALKVMSLRAGMPGIAEVGSVATDRRRMSRYGVSLRSRSGGSERYVVAGGNGKSPRHDEVGRQGLVRFVAPRLYLSRLSRTALPLLRSAPGERRG